MAFDIERILSGGGIAYANNLRSLGEEGADVNAFLRPVSDGGGQGEQLIPLRREQIAAAQGGLAIGGALGSESNPALDF